MSRILIVDDDHAFALALETQLLALGHEVCVAPSAELGLAAVRQSRPDMVFLDVRLPGRSGIDALPELLQLAPGLPVVLMSSHGTAETAIDALARGAIDHVEKPIARPLLERLAGSVRATETERSGTPEVPRLVGSSSPMLELGKRIGIAARGDATVLVRGESGVGKELVARAIHERGARAKRPFIALSCAAVPDTLLEDELFGHTRGAFTSADRDRMGRIERADTGTLFLDEIGELAPRAQAKLLRFLEDRVVERLGAEKGRAVDVRIVAATNAPLEQRVADGLFREDLFYRLEVVSIHVPPLRERLADLPILVEHLLGRAPDGPRRTTPAVLELLGHHSWPGNVRELRNVLEAAALAAQGASALDLVHLPATFRQAPAASQPGLATGPIALVEQAAAKAVVPGSGGESLYDALIEATERGAISRALELARGNQVLATKILGMNRATFRGKMKKDGLAPGLDEPLEP